MRSMIVTACRVAVVSVLVIAQHQSAAAQTAGAQFAFVDLTRVTTESVRGQGANAQMQEFRDQKRSELQARNSQAQGEVSALNQKLQDAQQKLQQGQNVLSADTTADLQRDISRLQVDIQRATQDSQADLARLQEDAQLEEQTLGLELQIEFENVLTPMIDELASQKGLAMIINVQGLVWANQALDLTQELIDMLDSAAETTP